MSTQEKWDKIIGPSTRLFDLKLREVWGYRDLLFLFVRRDFVALYKQTILGPLWFFIQPLLTTLTFTIIFGNIAKIGTDGIPHIVFYLGGLTIWQYFADCLNSTASTFRANQNLFGKVYFPRIIVPLSIVVSGLMKFTVQFTLFSICVVYYSLRGVIEPSLYVLLTPLLILIVAFSALGMGMIFSSLTTKYRDLVFLLTFGVQLLMYGSPVIYPTSALPEKYQMVLSFNPLVHVIEAFRFAYLGSGSFSVVGLTYSIGFSIIIFCSGLIIFNRVERSFMDTV